MKFEVGKRHRKAIEVEARFFLIDFWRWFCVRYSSSGVTFF